MRWIYGLLLVVACAEQPATVARIGVPECPDLGCGLNGAWLGENLPFRELDLGTGNDPSTRIPNDHGLRIESFRDRLGNALAIDVVNDELLGRLGTSALAGVKLEGAVLTLVTAKAPVQRYFLRIEHVTQTGFWTESCPENKCDASDRFPLYTITYTREGGPTKAENLCAPFDPDPTTIDRGIEARVIVFRGDRYDADYTVTAPANTTWFNLACTGTAISKLHLLRHTRASRRDTTPVRVTSVAQRQTLLRLLTADYCGVGHPFTTDGHPLRYTFLQTWEPLSPRFVPSELASVDALWTYDAAVCIATPRLADEQPVQALLQDIRDVCGAPVVRCPALPAGIDVDAVLTLSGSYAISGNPL